MHEGSRRLDVMLELARQRDPSIEPKAGTLILRNCLQDLAEDPDATAAELARRCLARYRAADPSWVAHLSRAALEVERTRAN